MHSVWFRSTFPRVLKFPQLKQGGGEPNFWGEPILKNGWIICSLLCISILKVSKTEVLRQSLDFNAFCRFSRSTFLRLLKFPQIKEGGANYCENQFCRTDELFTHPFYLSILKVPRNQFLLHSLDFNGFCMIQKYFFQVLLQNNWIASFVPSLAYSNFKNFRDAIRFQYILCASFKSTFTALRGNFLLYLKFPQIKFLGGTNWSPLLYCNFKSFKDPNSL